MMTRYVPIAQGQRGYIGSNNFAGSGLPPYSRQPSYGSVGSRNTDTETIQDPYGILPEAAINRIVRDIGTNWKDLARGLDIPEGIIDEIECTYAGKLREKARKCLKIFMEDADPHRIVTILSEALDKCGRRDIKERIQEILSRRPY
ncbi:hypothetical protein L9F63_026970 [Diploptera punctata]|uniref:Death domain-containing protein n=1 Tax=Diploptera punctata TaxID=6984 RepID=A0AAD8ADQ1_DIPPU|nr:hypothetical protein L9F63_026970 [Diploptera punctata]